MVMKQQLQVTIFAAILGGIQAGKFGILNLEWYNLARSDGGHLIFSCSFSSSKYKYADHV